MHLHKIAFDVASGAHAAFLLDQAAWHGLTELVMPPNITLMPLPPSCPELNPAENVWKFMRDNWLSNRMFKFYDDIVDHCCFAWNKLGVGRGALCPSVCANGRMGTAQCT